MKSPKPVEPAKEPQAGESKAKPASKDKPTDPKAKTASRKPSVKKEKAAESNPSTLPGQSHTEPTDTASPQSVSENARTDG